MRFVRVALLVLLMSCGAIASATNYPALSGYLGHDGGGHDNQCPSSSQSGVCSCMTASATTYQPHATTFYQVEPSGMCDYTHGSDGPNGGIWSVGYAYIGYYCNGSDTLDPATNTCAPAPQNQCQFAATNGPSWVASYSYLPPAVSNQASNICQFNCTMVATPGTSPSCSTGVAGVVTCTQSYSSTGATCTAVPPGETPTCKAGGKSDTTQVTVGFSNTPGNVSGGTVQFTNPGGISGMHITDSAGCDAQQTPGTVPTGCSVATTPNAKGYYPVNCVVDFTQSGAAGAGNNTPADISVTSSPSTPNDYTPASPTGHCPAGSVAGTDASGNPACIGTTSSVAAANGGSTTPPPPVLGSSPTAIYDPTTGNTTTTSTTSSMNPDGSITTTTTTVVTLPNGTHTVSSTSSTGNNIDGQPGVQAPAGSGSGTGGSGSGTSGSSSGSGGTGAVATGNSPSPTICDENPSLNICKNSTVTGSQCEGSNGITGFTCTGDAIQCATLQQVADQNCRDAADRQAESQSAEFRLGSAVMGGNDPLGSNLPTPGNATNVDVGTLSSDGWLGGGSCFSDVAFSVMGQQISIPFSQVCQYLIVLRGVAMAIAGLVSFKMLSSTFLS